MPKVVVSGRGGTGKSTLVSLLARETSKAGFVLVVDADESNLGLASMLGLDPPAQTLIEHLGGKPAVTEKFLAMKKGEENEEVPFFVDGLLAGSLPSPCVSNKANLSMVRVGKIEHSKEGCACPMGVVARSFLNSLTVTDGRWVFVDTEAGIEHFGRGVLEGADLVLWVVDPSSEAVILSEKAARLCREVSKRFVLVLNKVDGATGAVLRQMLSARDLQPVGVLPYCSAIAQANLAGHLLDESLVTGELSRIISALWLIASHSARN